jgi:hypothetical protein
VIDYAASTLSAIRVRWSGGVAVPSGASEIATTGYRLYMDGGNDGSFRLVYDGAQLPGVLEQVLTPAEHGIEAGRAYRF